MSTRWRIEKRTGHHPDGRPWKVWYVYDYGICVFSTPDSEWAEQGIRDIERIEASRSVG